MAFFPTETHGPELVQVETAVMSCPGAILKVTMQGGFFLKDDRTVSMTASSTPSASPPTHRWVATHLRHVETVNPGVRVEGSDHQGSAKQQLRPRGGSRPSVLPGFLLPCSLCLCLSSRVCRKRPAAPSTRPESTSSVG